MTMMSKPLATMVTISPSPRATMMRMHALPPTMTTSPLPTTSMTSTPSAQQVRHGHRWQQVGSNDNKYAEGDDDSMYAKCVDDDKTLDKDNSNKYAKKCDLAEGNGNDKPLAEGQRKW